MELALKASPLAAPAAPARAARPASVAGQTPPAPVADVAPMLEVRGVAKGYGSGAARSAVLKDINLSIREGEFIAIVGFSGSGKTTLISLLAGLIAPDAGEILVRGAPVRGPGPDRGVVFQSYSLMPWMSVGENVALAVDRVFSHESAVQRKARVDKYVGMVNLSHAIDKRPAQLSGGMRQRVAVARALATSPDILLLDEPLSALDALTRAKLQDEITRIWSQERKTVVLITNDVDEALMLADRIIPLDPGPDASFGPEFVVDLERPRDRRTINHTDSFKTLRRAVTQYLMDAANRRAQAAAGNVVELPKVQPDLRHLDRGFFSLRHSARVAAAVTALPSAAPPAVDPRPEHVLERYVEFSQITKVYPTPKGPQTVVEDFDLKIRKGEFISIIGHSGCGKSTVLSMIAGLNDATSGVMVLDGREVSHAGPDRGIVFQAPSLVPWLTAYQNVALGVERVYPHASKAQQRDIVEYYLSRVGLADALHKRAAELSNGMRQRVGIARAFALSPKLLLLDEPFGMLDSLTRWELQEVLMEVWSRSQVTAIVVTHDVDEAILLADRVVMMTNGPRAKVGRVLPIDLPRPRTRRALLAHPQYYELRESLISFLEDCDHA